LIWWPAPLLVRPLKFVLLYLAFIFLRGAVTPVLPKPDHTLEHKLPHSLRTLETASPCRPLAGAVTSLAVLHPEARTWAARAAEPLGNCGFQGGPRPGHKRD
uniref:Uncharacterized protein n=1 Tax=Neovison vison TaxID=452646 RepID=A0A8C7BFF8_NEOVI